MRRIVFICVFIFISKGFLTFVDITLVTKLGERISLRMKRDLYDAILKQDMVFFDGHMQGEVIGRLTQDVSEFKHTFKLVITQVIFYYDYVLRCI